MLIADYSSVLKDQMERIRDNNTGLPFVVQKKLDDMWEDDHMVVVLRDDVYWVTHFNIRHPVKFVLETDLGVPFCKQLLRKDQIAKLDALL